MALPTGSADGATEVRGGVTRVYDLTSDTWTAALGDVIEMARWNSIKTTSSVTAVHGDHITAQSDGGAITITLPASPLNGERVTIDRNGSNDVSVDPGAATVETAAGAWVMDVDLRGGEFIYHAATTNWDITPHYVGVIV